MNKLMQRLNNNDLFFFSVFLIFAVVIVIEKDMVDIIYNPTLSKEDKILAFTNKINIKFQSYITYIINSTIKN